MEPASARANSRSFICHCLTPACTVCHSENAYTLRMADKRDDPCGALINDSIGVAMFVWYSTR